MIQEVAPGHRADHLTGPHTGRFVTTMRQRILFASYTSDTLGPTNSLLLLLKYLRHNHDVSVLAPGRGPLTQALEEQGIGFHEIPRLDFRSVPTISRLLRASEFDLVYLNNTCGAMRNTAIAASISRVPYLCHVREMGQGKSWTRLGYLRPAAAVVAVSSSCARSVERFVRRDRLHVVHNGVEILVPDASAAEDRKYARHVLGLPERATLVLGVAHVCRRKGQEHAVAAIADVVRAFPSVHLCLLGKLEDDPTYVAAIRDHIERRGLTANVHLLGFRSDVARLYRGADLFLHTALVDPHPRAVIEAMAAALPVVAFATDGVVETVLDGTTGHVVPQRDTRALTRAILHVVCNRDVARELGVAGRARVVEYFTASASAAHVDKVIRNLAARPRSSRLLEPSANDRSAWPRRYASRR